MTLRHFSITTADRLSLPAFLYQQGGNTTCAIFLHGSGSASVFYKPEKMQAFAHELLPQGLDFLAFNNRGAHYVQKLRRQGTEPREDVLCGTWMEKISECVWDIQAVLDAVKQLGYQRAILVGESTGANKICVWAEKTFDPFVVGTVLVGGGDDTGLWYQLLGEEEFKKQRDISKEAVENGQAQQLRSVMVNSQQLSHQSFLDVTNPDGNYNCFPFFEHSKGVAISTKPLFHAFKTLTVPTLALYGSNDIFCVVTPQEAADTLHRIHPHPDLITPQVVENADHSFSGMDKVEAQCVTQWWKQH